MKKEFDSKEEKRAFRNFKKTFCWFAKTKFQKCLKEQRINQRIKDLFEGNIALGKEDSYCINMEIYFVANDILFMKKLADGRLKNG